MNLGFDNDTYLKLQSEHIRKRITQFGNKLYLEFGGKLFDDYHASRVFKCKYTHNLSHQHSLKIRHTFLNASSFSKAFS